MARGRAGMRRGVRWARVAFDVLLRLYPAAFTRLYGDDIRSLFRMRMEQARAHGRVTLVAVLVIECVRLVPSLLRVRWMAITGQFAGMSTGSDPATERKETMSSVWRDLQLAVRGLRRNPWHTAAMALTLSLGIGANTTVFSIIRGVLLRPFSMPAADRLVIVAEQTEQSSFLPLSFESFRDYAAASSTVEHVAAFSDQSVNITGGDRPERLRGMFVTASWFAAVGVRPEVGTALSAEHDAVGGPRGVVLSHAVWLSRYGGEPTVQGRTLIINSEPHVIVGVMPEEYRDPWFRTSDVWVSMSSYPGERDRKSASFYAVARLAPGASIGQATDELQAISQRLNETDPDQAGSARRAQVLPMMETVVAGSRTRLRILMAAAALVLLLAIVNVANLQLVRASDRSSEMAVRTALGGSRRRLIRQLLTENIAVAAIGGAGGLLLARVGLDLVLRWGPGWSNWPVELDAEAIGFAAGLTLLTGILFGLVPAIRISQTSPGATLRRRSEAGTGRHRTIGLRATLVAVQVALAMVLMIDAGLLMRTVANLDDVNVGFRREGLLTMQFRLPAVRYDTDAKVAGFFQEMLDRVKGVAGVTGAATGYGVPFTGDRIRTSARPAGGPAAAEDTGPVDINIVSADYFNVLGIAVLRGRVFGPQDHAGSQRVAVISEQMAERLFPGEDALGRVIEVTDDAERFTVVGIVDDIHVATLQGGVNPLVYVAHAQRPLGFATMAVRVNGDPLSLVQQVQSAVWSLDPDQPLWEVMTEKERIEGRTADTRFLTMLLVAFAVLAAGLAATGTAGVVGHVAGRRTHEIGVRLALGARKAEILNGVLRSAIVALVVGIVAGTAGAVLSSRLLESSLFGVAGLDAATFVAVPMLLTLVTILATVAPARRATRVDPVIALRQD